MRVAYSLNADAYRDSPGLSHSQSKDLRRSPWHYKAKRETPPEQQRAPSPQMFMGTLVHCAVLESEHFDARYNVGPDVDKRSKAWREFEESLREDMLPITRVQYEQAQAMAASVRRLPDFEALMSDYKSEVSLWWDCPATGVHCKARPDVVKVYPPGMHVLADPEHGMSEERAALARTRGFAILADLKTTEDASPDAFARSVVDYSYHTQAQWYMEGAELALGIPVLSFLFAVVEREYPHCAASYTLDDNGMRVAGEINLKARELYRDCEMSDLWPSYADEGTRDIALPPWYMRRYLEGKPV